MSAFTYEIANVHAAVQRTFPSHAEGIYAVPWYLVIGDPGSGRSTALHAMNLTWSRGDGPLTTGLPQQLCTWWMPDEAVFIEPEAAVLGPQRQPQLLGELCDDLRAARPREAVDGLLLLVNLAAFIDLDERGIENYGNVLRRYLVEVAQRFDADVPVYVVITRYDTLWGFGEVFQWGPDRRREEPWGFSLPPDDPPEKRLPKIAEQLDGLNARLESFCFAKLASEDPPEHRVRAFQHLAEVRATAEKLRTLFNVLAMANAYERTPWIRAVTIGSALPGVGDHPRAAMARFLNMGLAYPIPAAQGTLRPGGLPFHAFLKTAVFPERDIVPLKVRWRDDKAFLICLILGVLFWLAAVIAGIVFAVTK